MGGERPAASGGPNDAAPDFVTAARAVAFTARRLERALGGMTLPQFRVLALAASSTERASRLAEQAAVSRPSLTGLLDGLEDRGWVRRVDVSGDRRGVLLEVTSAGKAALAVAERAMADTLGELFERSSAGDRRRALDGLTALADILRDARGPQPDARPPRGGNAKGRPRAHTPAAGTR